MSDSDAVASTLAEPNDRGMLDVGGGHSVYWEVRGNPGGAPAVVLHGGPGSGANASWAERFDPDLYRVVLFDQRGCGRSTPNAADTTAALEANTTQHLIDDVERLRRQVGVERWVVLGVSWGSVLGLAYAQAHPESVNGIVLFSIAGGSRHEVEWATRGAARFYPLEWQRFRDGVPERGRDGDLAAAYYQLLIDPDPAVHEAAAAAWCAWDDRQMRTPGQSASARFEDPGFRLCFARLVTHYWSHGHFLRDGQLLERACRLAGIPGVLIQGRLDLNQPVDLFWHLARHWPESELVLIDEEGHLGGKAMDDAILEATTQLASG